MHGTSQGSAHPEIDSTVQISPTPGVSSEVSEIPISHPQPFADGEWEAIVAAAVAAVAEIEAAEARDDTAEAAISALLEAQPTGSRGALTLPVAPGASAQIPTWHSRGYWLALCEWIVTHTDRGRAALQRHGIAAGTFVRGCAAHAQVAESATGRRVSACLDTLVSRSGLSVDQLKRCRRVLKLLELGIEQARGKKLNTVEREAAARLYGQIHGHAPARLQRGAASVWSLSAPRWAVEAMPAPEKKPRPQRRSRSRAPRGYAAAATRPVASATRRSAGTAPQSPSGSFPLDLSARKDHRARERAGVENSISMTVRPLALQRAAAELVERIPALRGLVGVDDLTGHRRGHVGSVCDLLVDAGIDTDRWTGIDIAQALTFDGATRGWTWPTAESMTSPLRLVAFRLGQLAWSGPSPTERKIRGRGLPGETPTATAYRLVRARRSVLEETAPTQAPPASVEHRKALRAQFAAELAARKSAAAQTE